jgi:twitching motility protein PilJ
MPPPDTAKKTAGPRGQGWVALAGAIVLVAAGLSFYNGGLYGVIAGVTALAVLVPLAMLYLSVRSTQDETRIARNAMETQKREGERNQAAILRLLDEIAGLGQGDLTATATVTEDITGAIADSVNIAVESLRGLVTTINASSEQLDGTARQTQALAQHLAKSSSAQSW